MKIEYKVFADTEFEGAWRVEGLSEETKEISIALFSGPDSERFAHEYEAFRNGKHPGAPASAPVAAPASPSTAESETETTTIYMKDGGRFVIRPKDLEGTFSKRWNSLTLKPRPAMQRLGSAKGKV